jgi:hypothetical protein
LPRSNQFAASDSISLSILNESLDHPGCTMDCSETGNIGESTRRGADSPLGCAAPGDRLVDP